MSKLIEYVDRQRATIQILKDYHDQLWKLENDPKRIREITEDFTSPRGMSSTPVTGGGSHYEENLCKAIDKKTMISEGYQQAQNYSQEFLPCWKRLTEEERILLTLRYVEHLEGNGIGRIMNKYGIRRSEAYNRSNAALRRLSKLIFW